MKLVAISEWRVKSLALAVSLTAFLCACSQGTAPARERPNVVLLMLDTLRPDHLELFGHERKTAPFLAELAGRSVVFANAFSTSSKTSPATASLFTGTYPTRHGVIRGLEVTESQIDRLRKAGMNKISVQTLPKSLPTLPELMREAGYRTYAAIANTNINEDMGFARGFDRFECANWIDAEETVRLLEPWAEELVTGSTPYFLYLHFIDPHHPY